MTKESVSNTTIKDPQVDLRSLQSHLKQLLAHPCHEQSANILPLQLLVKAQLEYGMISTDILFWIAQATNSTFSHVQSLCDFYSFLQYNTSQNLHLFLSTNVTDYWQGQQAVIDRFQQSELEGVEFKIHLTSCSGLCDQGPAALINGRPLTQLTVQRADEILKRIEVNDPLDNWPSEWFSVKPNVQQIGPLLNLQFQPGDLLQQVINNGALHFLEELKESELRGRGGAGFPTHLKWNACIAAEGGDKVVVCNADEGEPGTFKDRVLLSDYTEHLLEGMTIAGYCIGAKQGFIYLRHEYDFLLPHLERAIEQRKANGLLGNKINTLADFNFDIAVHMGAGAYICGEESALLESLEGKRGIPRNRPPFPVTHGYLGRPTVVNNVETFSLVTLLAKIGGKRFKQLGTTNSTGTKLHSISGDCGKPGIYEFPLGATVKELLQASATSLDTVQAVQVGGPSGKLILAKDFDTPVDFDHVSSGGSFMVIGNERCLLTLTSQFTHFFQHESCGFCTPCRVGTTLLSQALDQILAGTASDRQVEHIQETVKVMEMASHCGLGHTAGNPAKQLLQQRFELINARLKPMQEKTIPVVSLDDQR